MRRLTTGHLRALGCTAVLAATALAGVSDGAPVAAEDGATASRADRAARAKAATRPPRSRPVAIRDRAAARLVHRSRWEPRPSNRRANRHTPSKKAIRYFRRWSTLPRRYKRRVTGNYKGTTDEILQWAAYKWGFSPDVLRAGATIESWWRQRAIGDHGRSVGLFQIKKGHHCCFPTTRRSTAFNADYYAAWVRWVYDGRAKWLNQMARGARYRKGDLWGAIGAWYSGRWHHNTAQYIRRVKRIIRKHVWRRSGFRHGD